MNEDYREHNTEQPTESPTTDSKKAESKHGPIRSAFSTMWLLLFAALLGLALTKFVFQTYAVDGNSMSPTLATNDRLLVYKLPSTIAHYTGKSLAPSRGDVVIVEQNHLTRCGQEENKVIIKRVIGIPGDRVVVDDDKVTVYNKENPNGFDPDQTYLNGAALGKTPMDADVTVGSGEIFILGDNRYNSCDSRSFGVTQSNRVVGTLFLRIAPLNKVKVF